MVTASVVTGGTIAATYTQAVVPIYEYRCENGHTFEVMQRMTDDPVVACETCEAPVQRVFHPIAVHFKGSGFYNTDYGTRKRAKETHAAAEGDSKKTESSSSSNSDSGGDNKKKKDSGGGGGDKKSSSATAGSGSD
jgi:putative FmdB family regulatory protein